MHARVHPPISRASPLQSFTDARPEQLQRVVQTNLLGTLLCTRAAMQLMGRQPQGGHIFLMDGAGADGMPTPQYAAYGATKGGGSFECSVEGAMRSMLGGCMHGCCIASGIHGLLTRHMG